MIKLANVTKTGNMFMVLAERDQCMKGSGSLGDAPPSSEMVLVLQFEQISIFIEDLGQKNSK